MRMFYEKLKPIGVIIIALFGAIVSILGNVMPFFVDVSDSVDISLPKAFEGILKIMGLDKVIHFSHRSINSLVERCMHQLGLDSYVIAALIVSNYVLWVAALFMASTLPLLFSLLCKVISGYVFFTLMSLVSEVLIETGEDIEEMING